MLLAQPSRSPLAESTIFPCSSFVPHPLHLHLYPLYEGPVHTNQIFSVRIWSWQCVTIITLSYDGLGHVIKVKRWDVTIVTDGHTHGNVKIGLESCRIRKIWKALENLVDTSWSLEALFFPEVGMVVKKGKKDYHYSYMSVWCQSLFNIVILYWD